MAKPFTGLESAQLKLFEEHAPMEPVRAFVVPRPAVDVPAAPAAGVPGPALFRHPQASREIRLDDHLVAYALKRVRRRSIGFVVGMEGLSVNAPKWVGIADIELALREKARWILRKLHEQREREQRLQQKKVDWRDGTSIPFLGELVIVVIDPRATGAVLNTDAQALPGVPRLMLHVGLPQTAAPDQLRDAVQSWLQRQARRVFEERCRHFAQQLGVRYTRLSLSSAQTRWGSASADGSIRLNWRLIHFAMPTIDYVVAHELAHLRHMDHSPKFWDVVRSVVPDFEQRRSGLKDDVLPVFD
ncbi:M48 family metallopeptidase [Piscinibacter sp.]|uniref:M48 family metallopeptidase n=1 Tax=Piscinibacter sp. TaxID=1903157 RepID=UPI002CC542C0|nr:SprT family zinc-dependent metalloprotease [Albitalea sp.]HUG24742.1 SprT family zinc-dependent metalloprotease [Albitalea sp.]